MRLCPLHVDSHVSPTHPTMPSPFMKGEGATGCPRRSIQALRSLTMRRPGGGGQARRWEPPLPWTGLCCPSRPLPPACTVSDWYFHSPRPVAKGLSKVRVVPRQDAWYTAQLRGQGSPACPVLLLPLDSRSSSRAFGSPSLGARLEKELVHGPLAPLGSQGICCSPTEFGAAAGTWSQG